VASYLPMSDGRPSLGDVDGVVAAAHDAYRMAAAEALLVRQGLRATGGEGSHMTVEDAISAQYAKQISGFAKLSECIPPVPLCTGELVEASGLSRPFVIRQLKALQDAEILQWVGNSAKDPGLLDGASRLTHSAELSVQAGPQLGVHDRRRRRKKSRISSRAAMVGCPASSIR
jgi:DNA-binding transcriptional ArsR family regulator